MLNLKSGLIAVAAVAVGFAFTAAPEPALAQGSTKPAMSNSGTMTKPMTRRERDAAEREQTKKLNEQQLQRR